MRNTSVVPARTFLRGGPQEAAREQGLSGREALPLRNKRRARLSVTREPMNEAPSGLMRPSLARATSFYLPARPTAGTAKGDHGGATAERARACGGGGDLDGERHRARTRRALPGRP